MYLSDRELKTALDTNKLIIKPFPQKIDATSIDLHLDGIDEARAAGCRGICRQQHR